MFINRDLFTLARPFLGRIALTALLGVLASGASIAVAFGLVAVINSLRPGAEPLALATTIALVLAAVLTRAVVLWIRDQSANSVGDHATRNVRVQLVKHAFWLGPGHRWPAGPSAARATTVDGVQHLHAYVGLYLPQLAVAAIVPLCLIGIIFVQDPVVAIVIAASLITIPGAQALWSKLLGERADAHWEAYSRYAARIGDSIRGILTLVALNGVRRRGHILARDAEDLRRATAGSLRASLGVSVVTAAAMSVGTAGASLIAAWQGHYEGLAPATALLVLFLTAECFRPLQELQAYWHEGFYGVAAARGIHRMLASTPTVTDRADAKPFEPQAAPDIVIEDVTYRHEGATTDALKNVSLRIPAGSTVALVGASGAGKSTLASLILRDVDPDSGRILIDGTDVRDYRIADLRANTARVSQDVVLLDGTIRDCVRQGSPTASEADIEQAAGDARVTQFAQLLPQGLDSPVGESGSLLSGGQRQRVSLARAILRQSPVLILDEATSALDAENESLVVDALAAHDHPRTTVVIAHRLSTVINADLVAVMADGRIVEHGTPQDLAREAGRWAAMLHAHDSALEGAHQ